MKKLFVITAVAAVAFLATPSKASATGFVQCPGVNLNPNGCQLLVTINADGSISTNLATGTDNQPYDGSDDVLIGFQNNSPNVLHQITVGPFSGNGGGIFAFDGDGACTEFGSTCTGGDSTGYGGFVSSNSSPVHVGTATNVVTFTGINGALDTGTIVFGTTGIAGCTAMGCTGGSAWFSLESAIDVNGGPTPFSTVPEPGTLFLLGSGILGIAQVLRKKA